MTNALNLFLVIGAHIGIILLCYLIKRKYPADEEVLNNLNKFSSTDLKKSFLRLLIILGVAFPPLLLTIFIKHSSDFLVYSVFKLCIPYLLAIVLAYSLGIYLSLVYNLTAEKSQSKKSLVEDYEKAGTEISNCK
jgi:uncharacterized membrane protein